jgi:hypothetical protein
MALSQSTSQGRRHGNWTVPEAYVIGIWLESYQIKTVRYLTFRFSQTRTWRPMVCCLFFHVKNCELAIFHWPTSHSGDVTYNLLVVSVYLYVCLSLSGIRKLLHLFQTFKYRFDPTGCSSPSWKRVLRSVGMRCEFSTLKLQAIRLNLILNFQDEIDD